MCEQFLQINGIVYPKWSKVERIDSKDKNNNSKQDQPRWQIENFVYSFSKHIEVPPVIKIKTQIDKHDQYNNHVQSCPYRVCNRQTEKFKIFPH